MAWSDKYLKAAQSEEKHDSAVPFKQSLFTETRDGKSIQTELNDDSVWMYTACITSVQTTLLS